jgi:hypothetical protein
MEDFPDLDVIYIEDVDLGITIEDCKAGFVDVCDDDEDEFTEYPPPPGITKSSAGKPLALAMGRNRRSFS